MVTSRNTLNVYCLTLSSSIVLFLASVSIIFSARHILAYPLDEMEMYRSTNHTQRQQRELKVLRQQLDYLKRQMKPPFIMPKSMKFCDQIIDLRDPFIHRRVKREINEIVFHEGMLGNLIDFSGEFFPIIEPVLAKHGVPDDLKYLVPVESNFKIHAASYAGAKGPWQFISSSARRYGLRFNATYDERYNLEKATNAAARHLLASYKLFGDWLLAITAYNKGDRGVNNILSIQGIELSEAPEEEHLKANGNSTLNGESNHEQDENGAEALEEQMAAQRDSNFWDLVLLVRVVRRGRTIGYRDEQERYVPRVLAMKLIFENIFDYDFLKFDRANQIKPIPTDRVIAPYSMASLDVSKALSMSLWNLKYLNPQYKGMYPVFPKGREFLLPAGLGEKFNQKKFSITRYKPKARRRSTHGRKGKHKGPIPKYITLKSGETLWDISQYYGVSMKHILRLNGISYRKARYLRPGKRIRLK